MSIVVSSWAQPTVTSRNNLVRKVGRVVGFDPDNDTDFERACLDALDDTVNDMNSGVYEFNRVLETSITLTASTQSYDLNSNVYKEAMCYLNKTSDSEDISPMTYYTWSTFKRKYYDNTETGTPYAYSFYNFEREGKVYIWPTPDSTTASDYTMTFDYYRRIPLISSVGKGSSISVPREVENVLIYGGQKRIAINVLGAGHSDVAGLASLEAQALERLKKADKTHPDAKLAFRLGSIPSTVRRQGSLYVRIN